MPLDRSVFDPDPSRNDLVEAHRALYCHNHPEEFHIPGVHDGSQTGTPDCEAYRTDGDRRTP